MELLILSCTVFLACHIVNHLPDECVDTVSIKTLGECFDRVYFRAATEASRFTLTLNFMSYNLAQSNSAFRSCLNRMMVLCFLSRALPRARHSPSPLGRQLCSAGANKPVLTLFTKVRTVYTIKLGEAVCLSAWIHRNHRLNGLSLLFLASLQSILLCGFLHTRLCSTVLLSL